MDIVAMVWTCPTGVVTSQRSSAGFQMKIQKQLTWRQYRKRVPLRNGSWWERFLEICCPATWYMESLVLQLTGLSFTMISSLTGGTATSPVRWEFCIGRLVGWLADVLPKVPVGVVVVWLSHWLFGHMNLLSNVLPFSVLSPWSPYPWINAGPTRCSYIPFLIELEISLCRRGTSALVDFLLTYVWWSQVSGSLWAWCSWYVDSRSYHVTGSLQGIFHGRPSSAQPHITQICLNRSLNKSKQPTHQRINITPSAFLPLNRPPAKIL